MNKEITMGEYFGWTPLNEEKETVVKPKATQNKTKKKSVLENWDHYDPRNAVPELSEIF